MTFWRGVQLINYACAVSALLVAPLFAAQPPAQSLAVAPAPTAVPIAELIGELREVGSTRLRVLFWTIYDSTLYSADGEFQQIEPDLALAITYRRDIPATELIERTFDEWEDMGLNSTRQSMWRSRLGTLWPDVESGDTLTLYVDEELASRFYFNGRFIGTMMDSEFTRQFLAIWLADDTAYPRQRTELTGRAE